MNNNSRRSLNTPESYMPHMPSPPSSPIQRFLSNSSPSEPRSVQMSAGSSADEQQDESVVASEEFSMIAPTFSALSPTKAVRGLSTSRPTPEAEEEETLLAGRSFAIAVPSH